MKQVCKQCGNIPPKHKTPDGSIQDGVLYHNGTLCSHCYDKLLDGMSYENQKPNFINTLTIK